MSPVLIIPASLQYIDPPTAQDVWTAELRSAINQGTGQAIGVHVVDMVYLAAKAEARLRRLGLTMKERIGFELTHTPAVPGFRGKGRYEVASYTLRRTRAGWTLVSIERKTVSGGKAERTKYRASYSKIATAQKRATADISPLVAGF